MVVLSIVVFALALAASVGTIVGTVMPRAAYIAVLLRGGTSLVAAGAAAPRRSTRAVAISVRRQGRLAGLREAA